LPWLCFFRPNCSEPVLRGERLSPSSVSPSIVAEAPEARLLVEVAEIGDLALGVGRNFRVGGLSHR
jgi:hypothetical protein